jgi:hypothetical protein
VKVRFRGHGSCQIGMLKDTRIQRVLVTGSLVCVATLAVAAVRGRVDSGSAVAPINATSHVVFGPAAGDVDGLDLKHTLLGVVINAGASVFWAGIYQPLFDRARAAGTRAVSVALTTTAPE